MSPMDSGAMNSGPMNSGPMNSGMDSEPDVVWLRDRGCPSWCASGEHASRSSAEDRAHWGEFHETELVLHEPVPMIDGTRAPDRVITVLEQDEGAPYPQVRQVTAQGHDQLVMTLDEAEQVARTLLLLTEQARAATPSRGR